MANSGKSGGCPVQEKKRSGALAAARTPKSFENRKDGGGTSTQYHGKLNWAVPAKKRSYCIAFSPLSAPLILARVGATNRITEFDANGRLRCGEMLDLAASKRSRRYRVRLSVRVCTAFIFVSGGLLSS